MSLFNYGASHCFECALVAESILDSINLISDWSIFSIEVPGLHQLVSKPKSGNHQEENSCLSRILSSSNPHHLPNPNPTINRTQNPIQNPKSTEPHHQFTTDAHDPKPNPLILTPPHPLLLRPQTHQNLSPSNPSTKPPSPAIQSQILQTKSKRRSKV
eukprot:TRINITY_DN30846_c0_g1_i1.p1 TRINITY_DN30846_c0_g1~~TRINITY_DN30846_c0_g1_i1.p1  ORF type:complete len:158 (-),score=14.33 TRINITY_DN30846_c0_g1_i1:81-554(-)